MTTSTDQLERLAAGAAADIIKNIIPTLALLSFVLSFQLLNKDNLSRQPPDVTML